MTHLCDLLQKLKPFDVIVPLDSEPIGYWFQTLPHFVWAANDNPLPLITAEDERRGQGQQTGSSHRSLVNSPQIKTGK